MTAALGVILDHNSNTQKFFGGGQVANKHKTQSSDMEHHTNDITAMCMSNDRTLAATGQVGPAPACFVWDSASGTKVQRFKLAKGARGLNAVAFSQDAKYCAMVDLANDHNVYCFDVSSGQMTMTSKGDTNKIMDVAFSQVAGDYTFCTVGAKHIKFWNATSPANKRGIFGGKAPLTSFACVTYDDSGNCYTGGCNAQIYTWKGNGLVGATKVHKAGFICGLVFKNGKLISGGKDGNVIISSCPSITPE